jgi:hypothetical protein
LDQRLIAILIDSFVDAARRVSRPDSLGPGRVALRMITLVVPKAYRDDFIENLLEEYEIILRESSLAEARRWFLEQVLRSIPPCLQWRLERAIRFLRSEEFLARLILIAIVVYLLPALLAVILVFMVGIVICFLVDASSRHIPPIIVRMLEEVRSVVRRIVDFLKSFFRRGGEWYRTWRPEFRPAGAHVWPRFARLFMWIIPK